MLTNGLTFHRVIGAVPFGSAFRAATGRARSPRSGTCAPQKARAPDAQLEIAELRIRAGGAAEAGWLLEDAVRRHPQRRDQALALARVSLLLGNPAHAREVADAVPIGSDGRAWMPISRAAPQTSSRRACASIRRSPTGCAPWAICASQTTIGNGLE